jgi:hypothetical protein
MSLKWIVEFEVSNNWVADQFDLVDEQVQEMLAARLPYAFECEIKARVIKRPSKLAMDRACARHDKQVA